MLSKTERNYLSGIQEFEDKAVFYGKVVRSRIRRKTESAIRDLILIIQKDKGGRRPVKEWRERQNREILRKENPTDQELMLANLRGMFNRTWRGRRESRIIKPFWVLDLVYAYARQDPWMGDCLVKEIKKAIKDYRDEARSSLLRQYREDWTRYGDDWLEQYLGAHESECHDAGFKGQADCIAWLKEQPQLAKN